jgi:hypothetical protein
MTNLVGILCGDKIFKRAFSCGLLFVVTSTFFLSSFVQVFAQSPQERAEARQAELDAAAAQGGGVLPDIINSVRPSIPDGTLTAQQDAALDAATGYTPASDEVRYETPVVVTGEIDDPILKVLHAIVVTGLGWLVWISL